jgi:two-component system, NarL family, response regulator LiaR
MPAFSKYKSFITYGFSLALLLFVLKWIQLRSIIWDHSVEIYMGVIALLFTGLGIWLAVKLTRPKVEKVIEEKIVYIKNNTDFTINGVALEQSGISKRELEVLQLMAEGCSNQEIADKLFVSLSTVKTHTSNLFEKLDVRRRTQAIEKAQRMQLIP